MEEQANAPCSRPSTPQQRKQMSSWSRDSTIHSNRSRAALKDYYLRIRRKLPPLTAPAVTWDVRRRTQSLLDSDAVDSVKKKQKCCINEYKYGIQSFSAFAFQTGSNRDQTVPKQKGHSSSGPLDDKFWLSWYWPFGLFYCCGLMFIVMLRFYFMHGPSWHQTRYQLNK